MNWGPPGSNPFLCSNYFFQLLWLHHGYFKFPLNAAAFVPSFLPVCSPRPWGHLEFPSTSPSSTALGRRSCVKRLRAFNLLLP